MEEFLVEKRPAADDKDLTLLEQTLGGELPQEYRQLLLIANGADFKNGYLNLTSGREDWVQSYSSWSLASTELNTLLNHDNEGNLYIQYQDHLFPIAITSKGNQILIGISGVHRDKIFISDQDDDVSEDERTVFPVYQIADTLTDFLQLLQPNPEE